MKKLVFLIAIVLAGQVAIGQAYFPSMDSLRRYIDRYIRNSAIEAFTNLRLNTALKGLAQHIDSARINGGGGQIDTLFAYRSSDSVYFRIGANGTAVFMYKDSVGAGGGLSIPNNFRTVYGRDPDSVAQTYILPEDTTFIKRYIVADTTTSVRSDQSSTVLTSQRFLIKFWNEFFGGTGDDDSCKIAYAYSYDGAITWINKSYINIPSGKLSVMVPNAGMKGDSLTVIALVKHTATTSGLYQFKSADFGATWGAGVDISPQAGYLEMAPDRLIYVPKFGKWFFPYDYASTGDISSTGNFYGKVMESTDWSTWTLVPGFTAYSPDSLFSECDLDATADSLVITGRTRSGTIFSFWGDLNGRNWGSIQNTGLPSINSQHAIARLGDDNIFVAAISPRWTQTLTGFEVRKFMDLYVSSDMKRWIRSHRISDDSTGRYFLEPSITALPTKVLVDYSVMGPAPFKIQLKQAVLNAHKFDYIEGRLNLPYLEVKGKHSTRDSLALVVTDDAYHSDGNGYVAMGVMPLGDSTKRYNLIQGHGYNRLNGLTLVGIPYTNTSPVNTIDAAVTITGRLANGTRISNLDILRVTDSVSLNPFVLFRVSRTANSPKVVVPVGVPLITGEEGAGSPTLYGHILYRTGANYPRMFWGHDGTLGEAPYHPIISINKTIAGSRSGFSGGNVFGEFEIQGGLAYYKFDAGQYDVTGGRSVDFSWYHVQPDNVLRQSMRLTTNAELIVGDGPAVPAAAFYLKGRGATSATRAMRVVNSSSTTLFDIYNNGDIIQIAGGYHNWGATLGSGGYGFRDNAGVMEFKNSSGAWAPFGTGSGGLGDPGGNGVVVRTALNTTINRTLTGTTNRIVIANQDGTAGNPTFDIGTDVVTLTATQTLSGKTLTSPIINRIIATGSTPTFTAGPAAGTSPTITVTGTDMEGEISVTVGTSPASNDVILDVNFTSSFANPPTVVFCPSNNNISTGVYMGTTAINAFSLVHVGALTTGLTYKWKYIVIGK